MLTPFQNNAPPHRDIIAAARRGPAKLARDTPLSSNEQRAMLGYPVRGHNGKEEGKLDGTVE